MDPDIGESPECQAHLADSQRIMPHGDLSDERILSAINTLRHFNAAWPF
jgi:hypothetical protein